VALAAAACAATPVAPLSAPMPIASFQAVAGEWKGTITGALGASTFQGSSYPARLTVAPDGTVTSSINGMPGQASGQIREGKIVFEGSRVRGTATLHERAGQPVLRGEGTLVGMPGWSVFELTR
jgi:hypothetical protein